MRPSLGIVRLIAMSASRFDRLNSRAVATSCRSRSGYRSVNLRSREARKRLPNPAGGADPGRARELGARAAGGLLVGGDGGFHRLRAVGDTLASLGQEVAGLAAI